MYGDFYSLHHGTEKDCVLMILDRTISFTIFISLLKSVLIISSHILWICNILCPYLYSFSNSNNRDVETDKGR